jgi:hypothetical protein
VATATLTDIEHTPPNPPTSTAPTAAAEPRPAEQTLLARLAAVDAAMTDRCQVADIGFDVDTAHVPVDYTEHLLAPLSLPQTDPDPYTTPVAALLQRAHQRNVKAGWCRGYAVDGQGAICLQWAIHLEAAGNTGLELRTLDHLLHEIRIAFPAAESVPSWNDSHRDGRLPLRFLGQASDSAAERGI